MEFEEHEDQEEEEEEEEEEISLPTGGSYESLGNAPAPVGARVKMSGEAGKRPVSRYRECLKNHAVNIGGHAVDGCGEFMPAGEEGTLDALKCAACNCHRNFHRKETEGEVTAAFHHHSSQFSPYYRPPPTPTAYLHMPHRTPLALPSTSGGGGGTAAAVAAAAGHARDDQDDVSGGTGGSTGLLKKRFRTKFTQEQKDKMLAFAERLGWRIQKHDEATVQQFCMETGVKRHVLKVWMHNNKHTLGKKA
ncbi:unnamed protein product [Victoria cruziana]